jgi:hypothetical protein
LVIFDDKIFQVRASNNIRFPPAPAPEKRLKYRRRGLPGSEAN